MQGDLFANISIMPVEVQRELDTNSSSNSVEVNGGMIVNVNPNGSDVNGASSANISGSTRVEVYEGQDVTLTFVVEAYPPIRNQDWTTPTHINSRNSKESYTANGYRLAC